MTQDDYIEVDPEATYCFKVSEKTDSSFSICRQISEWLVTNLSSLTDDDDNILFNKVNTGFNENSLKTFGVRPTCDVHIQNIEYDSNFDYVPRTVNTNIIFYLKGANNVAYMKICELHDYIMQEFLDNTTFKELEGIVSETRIVSSQLMSQPINKKWGVMGAFELSHRIY